MQRFSRRWLLQSISLAALTQSAFGHPRGSGLPPPTSVTLTAFAPTTGGATAGLQRDSGLTTGSPTFAGTYSGGTPIGFQGRVRKISDNSVVVDWTNLSSLTFSAGSFSGKLPGVPQGGSYYRDVRVANATSVTATESTPFFIGIGLACYGQSSMNAMFTSASTPPAANANTAYFDGTNWNAVPNANGIRQIMNTVATALGVPIFACNGSQSGTALTDLMKSPDSFGYYAAFLAKVKAMGGAEFFLWRHGPSAAVVGTGGQLEESYVPDLDQLHSDIANDNGRTKSTMPMVLTGMATYPINDGIYDNDKWDAVNRALIDAGSFISNSTYSTSAMDSTLLGDGHEDGAGCDKVGLRMAWSLNTLLSVHSGRPAWFITGGAIVDATHTNINIAHSLGTDFTPTSGISGFEVSSDNGGTWAAATAAVRNSATQIGLTHASASTTSTRRVRYQYGKLADVSAPVIDNSSVNAPLVESARVIAPTPLSVLPVPTYLSDNGSPNSNVIQTRTGIPIGPAQAGRMIIVGVVADIAVNITSATLTPNVGSAISLTIAKQTPNATQGFAAILYGVLLSDANAAVTADLSITFNGTPFGAMTTSLWWVPSGDLSSTTPVDSQAVHAAAATSATISNLTTSSGGFTIVMGMNGSTSSSPGSISGTESYVLRKQAGISSGWFVAADCSNVGAHAGNSSITVTFAASDNTSVVAASWR